MEVFYIRDDGTRVKGYATYSYRNGPFGQWMVGDTPLHTLNQITREDWMKDRRITTIDGIGMTPGDTVLMIFEHRAKWYEVWKWIKPSYWQDRRRNGLYRVEDVAGGQ
jgi:hypothetical protein